MLKTLILSAAAAGLAAGLLTAALQEVTTTPIIIAAERYEGGEGGHDHGRAIPPGAGTIGTHDAPAAPSVEWSPRGGVERTLYTSLATIVMAVGFGLTLLGAMILSGRRIDGASGLAFGAAGFISFALAPALGLPPELPGSAAADLAGRQAWWMLTAVCTGGGLAALLLGRNVLLQSAGVLLVAAPHIVGAPQPGAFASTAPAELAGHFAAASLVVGAVFWSVLGFVSGGIYRRLVGPE